MASESCIVTLMMKTLFFENGSNIRVFSWSIQNINHIFLSICSDNRPLTKETK